MVHLLHYIVFLPSIKYFSHCRIAIYPREHGMPHFHIEFMDGGRVGVAIDTLEVISGSVRPLSKLREPMAWARDHQELLRRRWQEITA
jgi:hypothetical protein